MFVQKNRFIIYLLDDGLLLLNIKLGTIFIIKAITKAN